MIKLTALHYKIKLFALERFHNISQYNETLLLEWEKEVETARNLNDEIPKKPFIEPFEFDEEDYDITEKKFRVRLKDIYSYKENYNNITELTVGDDITYTIKETVDEIDALFEKSLV